MKHIIIGLAASVLMVASCAKEGSTNTGELSKNEFDAWISFNKEASWTETELGSWIISLDPGDVENQSVSSVDDNPFLRLDYTITSLDGTVIETTSEMVSKRIGEYDKRNYYGPKFSYRGSNSAYAGIEEILAKMGVGGKCKVIIPGWLLTASRYSTKEEYMNAMSSSTSALIYDFSIAESVKDTEEWELALLKKAMGEDWDKADSLADGVYYVQDQPSDKPDTTYSSSSEVYINYICRRIDGTGIDTNLADSAKVFGCTGTGEPVLINWGDTADDLTMTSSESSIITGFSYGLFQMRPHEKGRVYMTSTYAYSTSGSGTAIPAYCPIYFEIEFVDEPED